MNLIELRLKLTALMGWLALRVDEYFYWFAYAVLLGLFITDRITLSGLILWSLTWIFLAKVSRRLLVFNKQLEDLNDKFAINQRKLSKSIKDHNEYVTETLSSQKKFFDSIIKPKKGDN